MVLFSSVAEVSLLNCVTDTASDLSFRSFILTKQVGFKKKYEEYLNLVPRIIPSFKNWKEPVTDFNFKKSLINIKNGLLGIAIVFNLINLIDIYKHSGKILEINWLSYFLVFSIFFYFSNKLILNFRS